MKRTLKRELKEFKIVEMELIWFNNKNPIHWFFKNNN